jgi:hypothetical protein
MAVHRRVDPYAHRALYQDCNHTGESQRRPVNCWKTRGRVRIFWKFSMPALPEAGQKG